MPGLISKLNFIIHVPIVFRDIFRLLFRITETRSQTRFSIRLFLSYSAKQRNRWKGSHLSQVVIVIYRSSKEFIRNIPKNRIKRPLAVTLRLPESKEFLLFNLCKKNLVWHRCMKNAFWWYCLWLFCVFCLRVKPLCVTCMW